MAEGLTISKLEEAERKKNIRRSWILSTPALVVLFSAASGPLLIVLVYSFLASGEYGGITWKFSPRPGSMWCW